MWGLNGCCVGISNHVPTVLSLSLHINTQYMLLFRLGTRAETVCLAGVFSLTSFYLNGALPCDSHPVGTVPNTTCQVYGGQSVCKAGVAGQTCGECLPGYYQLNASGCKRKSMLMCLMLVHNSYNIIHNLGYFCAAEVNKIIEMQTL